MPEFYDTQPTGENHDVDYRDPTDVDEIEDAIKNGIVDELFRKYVTWVRTKMWRRHVREAIARIAEYTSVLYYRIVQKSDETEVRQTDLEAAFELLSQRYDNQIAGSTSLQEVIDARTTAAGKTYTTLKLRLDAMEAMMASYVPVGFTVRVTHNLSSAPSVDVTAYDYAIGTEPSGLDTNPSGGFAEENIRSVPIDVLEGVGYIDITMPVAYTLSGDVTLIDANTLLIIDGYNTLLFNLSGGATGGEITT